MAAWNIIHIEETDSTNQWLRREFSAGKLEVYCRETGSLVPVNSVAVVADYQTAGRGCASNSWESERGQNLLFSMLIHPKEIPASRQFHISMAVSLAICEALGQYVGDLSIKWPNDIYWRDGKICGILIENTLQGSAIKDSIIGVGVNVNQRRFLSDAPNPVSLWQICEQETDREKLLQEILDSFEHYLHRRDIKAQYCSMLYRRNGFYPYADKNGVFMAEIMDVEDDGHLLLHDDNGQQRRYAFKEVSFI